ncbi:hypothetical protein E3P98_01918 [Wallemia ichthyophaga]|nr:hypothetical protein E3P98_01918 [Wallemia ichthyophaga]
MSAGKIDIKLNEILKSNRALSDRSAEDLFDWFACQDQSEHASVRPVVLTLAERQARCKGLTLKSLVCLAGTYYRTNVTALKHLAQSTHYTTFELTQYIDILLTPNPARRFGRVLDMLHCFSINFPAILANSAFVLFRYLNGIYLKLERGDKLVVMDILYNMLQQSLYDSNTATLISEAFNFILDRTPPPELSDRPLKNASMMSDFETTTESSTLLIPITNFDLQIVGQRLELLVLDVIDVDVDLPSKSASGAEITPPVPDLPPRPTRDPRIDVVLDIFPDQSPSFVEKALTLPQYAAPEALVEALLEGTVHIPQDEPVEQPRDTDEADELDFSRLRIGKAKNFGLTMDDAAREELKASVVRRAEEAQIEEIEAEAEDQLEDEEEMAVAVRSRPMASASSASTDTATPQVDYSILEKAFQENAAVFDKSSVTRRGKEREGLRQASGLDDSQIEGWYSQVMRNPRKIQRLSQEKDIVNNNLDVPVQEGRSRHSRGGSRGRGASRGGAGGGAGGRGRAPTQGAGHSGNNRQRQNKEKQGNAQRKKGHDKKFAGQAG